MPLLASEVFYSCSLELLDQEPGHEYERWPESELAVYLTGGIAQMAALKPTLFNVYVNLGLGPGTQQSTPAEYSELIDIVYNINSDGTEGPRIINGSFSAARAFGLPSCTQTRSGEYEVRTFTMHPENDSYFYVDPPAPAGQTKFVRGLVRLAPSVITAPTDAVVMANTTPETYREALKDWVLYRCFAKDQESSDSFQRSQAHYNAFMKFIGSPPRDKNAVPVAAARGETVSATSS